MVEYRIDEKPIAAIDSSLKDMSDVLSEVATTYRILLEVIADHEEALSSPSIDTFRRHLAGLVRTSMNNASLIADYSQKLVVVSEQANLHLTALDEHFNSAIYKHIDKLVAETEDHDAQAA